LSEPAIQVDGLSKRYRIGLEEERHETLVGAFVSWAKSPLRRFRRLRSLSRFERDKGDDIIWALRDVSFTVQRGEVVGVIGRNGAGKTTLLKVLSQITEPTSGRALIQGRVASLLAVGTGFHGELTGRENVYLNGTVLGMNKVEVDRKFDEIVAFSGVEKFIDTPVKRYSSGMKVRLAFAVAAHLEPEILLIDEVLAVGDIAFQKKCLGKMEDVAGTGRTVLFVSHNMQMIDRLCPRTILLENGAVVCDDRTSNTLERYYSSMRDQSVDEETGIGDSRHRRGLGQVRFTSIIIRDAEGQVRHRFHKGERALFELTYKVNERVDSLAAGLLVRSGQSREPLTNVEHVLSDSPLPVGHTGRVTIEIPQLPFRPGTYPLYFGLVRKNNRELKSRSNYRQRRPFDIVDDLTVPLVIEDEGLAPRRPGIFDIESILRHEVSAVPRSS
jgi:lipopolysaccharide transport system ATP-binding protein